MLERGLQIIYPEQLAPLKRDKLSKIFHRNPSCPDLHVGNVHHISVLVFGLHHHGGWPPAAYVVFVQDESRLLGVCVRVRLQPPGQKTYIDVF